MDLWICVYEYGMCTLHNMPELLGFFDLSVFIKE